MHRYEDSCIKFSRSTIKTNFYFARLTEFFVPLQHNYGSTEFLHIMAPYLLLGFLIAGVLHVFVPQKFYANYLSRKNRLSVLWAALLGIPLPLCSCGVIPTAIGLRNEKASKGAIASFLIATPQTVRVSAAECW